MSKLDANSSMPAGPKRAFQLPRARTNLIIITVIVHRRHPHLVHFPRPVPD
jgi:hypothetical protein